jgi:hypothetical protein
VTLIYTGSLHSRCDLLSPSHHLELAIYAIETAVIATSHKPALFVNYLETCEYLSDLERWLREWRIAIKVSKISAMLFAHTETQTSSALQGANQMGQYRPLSCDDDTLYKARLVDSHRSGEKGSSTDTESAGNSPKQGEMVSSSGIEFCCTSSSSLL